MDLYTWCHTRNFLDPLNELDYDKNGDLSPFTIKSESNTKIWWKCNVCNHEWKAGVKSRISNKTKCPECAKRTNISRKINENLTKHNLTDATFLMNIWNYEKNNRDPSTYSYKSGQSVWWKCDVCNHEWKAKISSKYTNKSGCPMCSRRLIQQQKTNRNIIEHNLSEDRRLMESWNYEKNKGLDPKKLSYKCAKRVWWKCPTCGNEWTSSISNRHLKEKDCPKCAQINAGEKISKAFAKRGTISTDLPEAMLDWDYENNEGLSPFEMPAGSYKLVNWKCHWCGTKWTMSPQIRKKVNIGCPKCNTGYHSSFSERAIFFYINKIFPDAISRFQHGDEKVEFDIFIPSINVAIEFDGYYWHKNSIKREVLKNVYAMKNDIKLIRIRDRRLVDFDFSNSSIIFYDDNFNSIGNAIESLLEMLTNKKCAINIQSDRYEIAREYDFCRRENSLLIKYPDLAKTLDVERNKGLTADKLTYKSNVLVWWKCPVCGDSWQASPCNRTKLRKDGSHKYECPKCARQRTASHNSLKIRNVETGVVYSSAIEAAKSVGGNFSTVCHATRNKKYTYKGYHWELVDGKRRNKTITGRIKNLDTGDVYENSIEAAKSINGDSRSINRACRGDCKTYKSYRWMAECLVGKTEFEQT